MYYDVVALEANQDYTLTLGFKDGKQGIFDIQPYLSFGIFNELDNISYFKQAFICYGAVAWPNGQDIAPKKLYDDVLVEKIAA